MTLLSPQDPPPGPSRTLLRLTLAAGAVAGLGTAAWLLARRAPEHPVLAPLVAKASPLPRSTPAPVASPSREAAVPIARATAHPAPLHVEADVPEASVFVDRRFVGKAPVDVRDLEPGTHRVNVSADGYAMHAEEVDIGAEPQSVAVRFTEIRLDESVAVVHKHALGSCRGVLRARPEGLRFEATSGNDSFRSPLTDLTQLEMDYLAKTLRVSLRGGRRYNFTAEGASADPLLVFQQKVDAVRKRLAP